MLKNLLKGLAVVYVIAGLWQFIIASGGSLIGVLFRIFGFAVMPFSLAASLVMALKDNFTVRGWAYGQLMRLRETRRQSKARRRADFAFDFGKPVAIIRNGAFVDSGSGRVIVVGGNSQRGHFLGGYIIDDIRRGGSGNS